MPRAISTRYIGQDDNQSVGSKNHGNLTYYGRGFFPAGNQSTSSTNAYDPVKYAKNSNLKYIGTISNGEMNQSNYFTGNNLIPSTP